MEDAVTELTDRLLLMEGSVTELTDQLPLMDGAVTELADKLQLVFEPAYMHTYRHLGCWC